MGRTVKRFILGVSKTMDMSNSIHIYKSEAISKNNISRSWCNVGHSLGNEMKKGLTLARAKNSRSSKRADAI